jgi:threonine aldolase
LSDPAEGRCFASDNFAPIHEKILRSIVASNQGHAIAYGGDSYSEQAARAFDQLFGRPVGCHFVFNGTAANILALMAFQKPYGAVLVSDVSHIANDESTAPERLLGMRLQRLPSRHGKLDAETVAAALAIDHGIHAAKPVALSITQPTELGTVYSLAELTALADVAHAHGLGVHMDGARLGCAVASLGVTPARMVVECGIDILSFGGTKQGMMCGEAVIVLRPGLAADFPYWQKCSMQLASKMRFIAAQFVALLADDLWLDNARQANRMAKLLESKVAGLDYVRLEHPVEANALFVRLAPALIEPLSRESFFWPWDSAQNIVRWMCSFDTEADDVERFVATLKRLAAQLKSD